MIKNDTQLTSAKNKLATIQQKISEFAQKYSDVELEFYNGPLEIEVEELESQINEYKMLTELPFEQAIQKIEPLLIDNMSELLAKLRIAAKLTQEQMAEALEWDQPNISRFENENYNSQTINKIVEYASALGIWLHIYPSLTEQFKPEIKTIIIEKSESLVSSIQDLAPTGTWIYKDTFLLDVRNQCIEAQTDDSVLAISKG